MDFVLGKTPFFSSFLHFFQVYRAVSQNENTNKHISGRNKKFGQNRPKKVCQSHFAQKRGKTRFLSSFLHFFKKIELFHRKTVRINIFPGGIKNSAKKKGKKGVLFWTNQ